MLKFFSGVVTLTLAAQAATAQPPPFPSRPLRLIVPNGAGGSTDFIARTLAGKLAETLGQQVIVDNRAGSGGIIGTEIVARAAPDGYTLLVGTVGNLAISPHLYRRLPYDAQRDFSAITQISAAAYVMLVNPALPVKSIPEFIAAAKTTPGRIAFASAGSGTGSHLSAALFAAVAAVSLTHIPYKGGGPALTDLIANQVQLMFNGIPASLAALSGGRLRALAVSSPARVAALAETPTLAECGLSGAEATSWTGLLAPAGTAPEIIARLNRASRAILQLPAVRARLIADGAEPVAGSASAFATHLHAEYEKWGKVVRLTGARAD